MKPVSSLRAMQLEQCLQQEVLLWDGAMGTSIQQQKLAPGAWGEHPNCQEYLVVSHPQTIRDIHNAFLDAGARVIETNTFGGNRLTLDSHGLGSRTREINRMAAAIACESSAAYSRPNRICFVAGSMGPGSLLPSLGHVDFDSLRDAYYLQALGLVEGGVDLIQVETAQDLLQVKAAVIGARQAFQECGRTLPVILQVTLEGGKMLLGSDILTAMHTLLPLKPAAIGVNCGTGPEGMAEAVERLSRHCPLPVIVVPNAGMPRIENGVPVFDLSPVDFAANMSRFALDCGVRLLGGCCGTTPAHIRALKQSLEGMATSFHVPQYQPEFTSLFQHQPTRVEPAPLIIGERTNANGSRAFRRALLADDVDAMVEMALLQQDEGAHMLDLSVAYAGRDETADMVSLTRRLNRELLIPVVFDCTDADALEAGLKHYGGHALINSINLEDGGTRARRVIQLAKCYGAGLICLAIDEEGMARTREHKLAICRRLYDLCTSAGIPPGALFFDPLTFTLASGDEGLRDAGVETLETLPLLRRHLPQSQTILGVSNISYGLKPAARRIINAVFLYHAVRKGLDAAIFHAGKVLPLNMIKADERRLAEDLIFNRTREEVPPLEAVLECFSRERDDITTAETLLDPVLERLAAAVVDGRTVGLEAMLTAARQKLSALDIINLHLLPAMQRVGELFSSGRMQLPFVLKSAQVMKAAVDHLAPDLESVRRVTRGTMVLATVRGDVHDVGKNLVDIILSNNGYRIVNLGINQSSNDIIAAVREHRPDALGISGLLVQSTHEMKELLLHMEKEKLSLPVVCGGAALTRDFVRKELDPVYSGPVHYAADAFEALRILRGNAAPELHQPIPSLVSSPPSTRAVTPVQPLNAPFRGVRRISLTLDEILSFLDRPTLFRARWKMAEGEESRAELERIIQKMRDVDCTEFAASYGYFNGRVSGKGLLMALDANSEALTFAAAPHSPAVWFCRRGDVVPLLAVTTGISLASLVQQRFVATDYVGYLLWYGFSAQLAEAMAEAAHQLILEEMGMTRKGSRRFSPGYPSWPDLSEQGVLARLLDFSGMGLELTENWQLVPEASVTALVVPR
ncbi:MAG: homocysteine S-methyltransferase family protein, partial [Candidatus Aminicenantes bacterium]|nr:homocysteine S-methyltransferase family protein [Candidatus Aminicenantes bacterium]